MCKAAGAEPQTPMGELTALPHTPGLVPRPRFPTAADGLHHRYVETHRSNFLVLWILSVTQSLCRHKNGVSFVSSYSNYRVVITNYLAQNTDFCT